VSSREDRIAENETIFRDANEQLLRTWTELNRQPLDEVLFVCECGDVSCRQVMRLTLAEYEAVRADSSTFAVINGHDDPSTEQVVADTVAKNDRFAVVRKKMAQRRITERADRREHPDHGG
jgi:hypothetical protein